MAEAKPENSKQSTSKQVKGAENSGHDSTVGQLGFKYKLKANWGRKGLKEPFGGIMPFAPASQVTRKGRPTLTAHISYDSPLTIPTTRKAVLLGPPTPLDHTLSINPTGSWQPPTEQVKDTQVALSGSPSRRHFSHPPSQQPQTFTVAPGGPQEVNSILYETHNPN